MSTTGVTLPEGVSLDAAFKVDGDPFADDGRRWMVVWYDPANSTYLTGYVRNLDDDHAFVVLRHDFADEALEHAMREVGHRFRVRRQ